MRTSTTPVVFFSVAAISQRWGVGLDKTARVLEPYRGRVGFLDLGSPENVRTHKRRYSIVKIHPTLLAQIEAEL
jgi:hypothetical protein